MNKVMRELRQKELYEEILHNLYAYNKCSFVRVTGIGKTYVICQMLIKLNPNYKKILFVNPFQTNQIDIENKYFVTPKTRDQELVNEGDYHVDQLIDFCCYHYLSGCYEMTDVEILNEFGFYDLIVFDEMHLMGGEHCGQTIEKIFKLCKNTHIVGATATPDRTDGLDVIKKFFGKSNCSKYTFEQAIEEGILTAPLYKFCYYDKNKQYVDYLYKEIEKATQIPSYLRKRLQDNLDEINFRFDRFAYYPQVIKETLDECPNLDKNYMKWIVYCPKKKKDKNTGEEIDFVKEKEKECREYFQKVFPNHTIRTHIYTSTHEDAVSAEELFGLEHQDNTIDLIFSINKLNLGIHMSDLTGVIMFRETISKIIYGQQLGRCFDASRDQQLIVFDLVDNIFIDCKLWLKSIFGKSTKERKTKKKYSTNYGTMTEAVSTIVDGGINYAKGYTAEMAEIARKFNELLTKYSGMKFNYHTFRETPEASIVALKKECSMRIEDIYKNFPEYSQSDIDKLISEFCKSGNIITIHANSVAINN